MKFSGLTSVVSSRISTVLKSSMLDQVSVAGSKDSNSRISSKFCSVASEEIMGSGSMADSWVIRKVISFCSACVEVVESLGEAF